MLIAVHHLLLVRAQLLEQVAHHLLALLGIERLQRHAVAALHTIRERGAMSGARRERPAGGRGGGRGWRLSGVETLT